MHLVRIACMAGSALAGLAPAHGAPRTPAGMVEEGCRTALAAYVHAGLDEMITAAPAGRRQRAGVAYLSAGCPPGQLLSADHAMLEAVEQARGQGRGQAG